MTVEFSRMGRSHSAAGFLETLPGGRPGQGLSFEEQLSGVIRESLIQAGLRPDQFSVTLSAAGGWESGARRILVSVPAVGAEAAVARAEAAAGAGAEAADPVSVLKGALRRAGLDPEGFSLTESRELVWWPGGTYVNHQILFEAGAARESYGVALMLRNPEITVLEIRRLLGLSGSAPA